VGVMGTLIALELKKQNVISRSDCPYCQGVGKLPCAQCYGSGVLLVKPAGAGDAAPTSVPCTCCKGTALIMCVICRGDGQAVPVLLEQKGNPARGVKGVKKNSLEPDDDFDYEEEVQVPVYADAQRR
jgi:hypothetical protein